MILLIATARRIIQSDEFYYSTQNPRPNTIGRGSSCLRENSYAEEHFCSVIFHNISEGTNSYNAINTAFHQYIERSKNPIFCTNN